MKPRSPIEMMVDQACGFDPSVHRRRELEPEAQSLLSVADAAKAWWEAKRPVGWTVDDHIATPRVNASDDREWLLCSAVAEMVRLGG